MQQACLFKISLCTGMQGKHESRGHLLHSLVGQSRMLSLEQIEVFKNLFDYPEGSDRSANQLRHA